MNTSSDLDLEALTRLKQLGGTDLVQRMFGLFEQYGGQRVAEAREAGRSRNLAVVAKAAHALRSTSGNIGALRLYGIATQLEKAAHDERTLDVSELLGELDTSFAQARCELSTLVTAA